MRKLDYLLNTSHGNYQRYKDRYYNRFHFEISQETYSKTSMPQEEKERFQQELDAYMRSNNRAAFRGPVVLQLDFYPKKGNPPSIHKLAKNYIDLLYPRESKKLRLPMKDDQQVSILIVNYHVQRENKEPLIRLTLAPMRDYIEDLQLYDTIRFGSGFSEDDGDYDYDKEELIKDVEKYNPNELEETLENLRGIREMISKWKGDSGIRFLEEHSIRDVQSAFMKGYEINPSDLTYFYRTDEISKTSMLDWVLDHQRKLIISPPFSPLRPTGLPIKEGETEKLKKMIGTMLDQFKERFVVMVPFLINIKVTILYVPATSHEKDLDNLARKIIPLINDVLKPPAGMWFDMNPRPKGFPKHSIIQYQIVKLPRSVADPEEGVARVILGEYEPNNNLWMQTDRMIDTWASRIF